MRVLVAFGSKRGGTEGIARMIGKSIEASGVVVDVMPAKVVNEVTGFDGVVVCGAVYMSRWHRDARRFVKRFRAGLQRRSTWLVASGPLDDTASSSESGVPGQVASLAESIGANEAVMFGGFLSKDAKGPLARSIAKDNAGDWRDSEQIEAWSRQVVASLRQKGVAVS